ncbi:MULTISPECIES: hypothetical protein [unclassified Sphingobium]|uniref:hypothetical protein n=1 Tax=unclassified Sphingobium TaxID=2611147 RepID=UPI002224A434|nr:MULTISPECIES: hypothetical protein [unclassified Sphingobium]MCW2396736.1 hypothetical protein [Sphingobium sp. B8D3B]MCW2420253.1 hypothetical protein [Sphingobium sp. B8D3C]
MLARLTRTDTSTDTGTAHAGGLIAAWLALVLLARLLVPAGFMPAVQNGPAVVLCTGAGMITGWIDADGTVRKQQDKQNTAPDAPCAFAGIGASLDSIPPGIARVAVTIVTVPILSPSTAVSIGRGLAAPPPPQTGPPHQP